MTRKGRRRVFYGCNRYPECDFTTPHKPLAEPCPKCAAAFIVEKRGKLGTVRACLKEDCDWEVEAPDTQPMEGWSRTTFGLSRKSRPYDMPKQPERPERCIDA